MKLTVSEWSAPPTDISPNVAVLAGTNIQIKGS